MLEMLHFPPNNESKMLKRISDYIIEFVCGYATCATFWWCTNTFGRAVYSNDNDCPYTTSPDGSILAALSSPDRHLRYIRPGQSRVSQKNV